MKILRVENKDSGNSLEGKGLGGMKMKIFVGLVENLREVGERRAPYGIACG